MTPRQIDARMAAAVERSRARAAALGELTPRRIGPIEPVVTGEARALITEWLRDGGYERALQTVAEVDPELSVQ